MRHSISRHYAVCLTFVLSTLALFHDAAVAGSVIELSAPELGVTQTSVLLLWSDTETPDFTVDASERYSPKYIVFQDGREIGRTQRHCYTAEGLKPGVEYVFNVRSVVEAPHEQDDEDRVQDETAVVITEQVGETFNVVDYGAVGDGQALDTSAIQETIEACSKGGVVLVPKGEYRLDGLKLKSDMTLLLAKGATLSFVGYEENGDYTKKTVNLAGPDGEYEYSRPSLLSGHQVSNVTITGQGTVDGNGEQWWPFRDQTIRPFAIEFVDSSNILVQGITIIDAPAWVNHLIYVDNAIYSGVKIKKESEAHGTNGDGINPQSSRNVLIVGCMFANQDDSIAIKSGRCDALGDKRFRSTEDIVIRDCVFDGAKAPGAHPLGCAIGSENSGGVRRVVIQDCTFNDVASVVSIKTNRKRLFAIVEDVLVKNIDYTNTVHEVRKWNRSPLNLECFYYAEEGTDFGFAEPLTEATPTFRNFHFENISIRNPKGWGVYVNGLAENPMRDITMKCLNVQSRDGLMIRNTSSIVLQDVAATSLADSEHE